MNTKEDIVNAGLVEIGNTAFITDMLEQSQEAIVASSVYAHCVKRALEEGEWIFATNRAVLNQLTTTITNWSYAYTLPDDFLRMHGIVIEGAVLPPSSVRAEYEIKKLEDARVLFSNLEEVEIEYTQYVDLPTLYSAQFTDALILLLASKFASGLKKDRALAKDLEAAYRAGISEASAASRNQRETQKLEPRTPSERARGGSDVFGGSE